MTTERENRAWHVAGHAYAATMVGCPVQKLSLDGFSEADLQDRGNAQCLDEWTMVRTGWPGPIGTHQFTLAMEDLMSIAVAGPAAELQHRQIPCTVPSVRQFGFDWAQAWRAAGSIWNDEASRLDLLAQWIHRIYAVIFDGASEFYSPVVSQLLERGTMTGDEVQVAWHQMKDTAGASLWRSERRRPIQDFYDDYELNGRPPLDNTETPMFDRQWDETDD